MSLIPIKMDKFNVYMLCSYIETNLYMRVPVSGFNNKDYRIMNLNNFT